MRRIWALTVGSAAVVGVCAGVLLHNSLATHRAAAASPKLPALFGEATWKRGARPAPNFTLRDARGRLVSLRSLRGSTVAISFLDSLCKAACPIEGKLLGAAVRAVAPAQRPRLVVVSVDPEGDTPASVRKALRKWTLPPDTMWLFGTHRELKRVWDAYDITVSPVSGDVVHSTAVYLLDRRGDERAGVLLPFTPGLVARDLRVLASDPA